MNPEDISKIMSHLGKMSHKKKPRSKEHMSKIGKAGAKKRWANAKALSTATPLQ